MLRLVLRLGPVPVLVLMVVVVLVLMVVLMLLILGQQLAVWPTKEQLTARGSGGSEVTAHPQTQEHAHANVVVVVVVVVVVADPKAAVCVMLCTIMGRVGVVVGANCAAAVKRWALLK